MFYLYYMQKSKTRNKTFAFLSEKLLLRNGMLLYLLNASFMGLGLSTATIYNALVLCCHLHCTIFFVIWNLSNWPEYRKKIDNREWKMEIQASKCANIVNAFGKWEHLFTIICIAGNSTLAVCAPSRHCFHIKMCEHISML